MGEGWERGQAGWPGTDQAAQSKSPRAKVGTPPGKMVSRACLPGDWPVTQPGASFLLWDSTQPFLWPAAKSIRRWHWAATGTPMTKVPTRVSSSGPVGSSGCPRWQSGQPGTEAPAPGGTLPKPRLSTTHREAQTKGRLWEKVAEAKFRDNRQLSKASPCPPSKGCYAPATHSPPTPSPLSVVTEGLLPQAPPPEHPHVAAWLSGFLHLPHLRGLGRPPNTGLVQEVRLL